MLPKIAGKWAEVWHMAKIKKLHTQKRVGVFDWLL